MNEYDDLFKDYEIKDASTKPIIEDPNLAVFDMVKEQRINRNILFVYIGVLLLLSVLSAIFSTLTEDSNRLILDQVSIVTVPVFEVTEDSGDPEYPYEIDIVGGFYNGSTSVIPALYVTYTFFDINGVEIGVYSISEEQLASGDTWSYSTSFTSSELPVDATYEYGIDQTSLFYLLINFSQVTITAFLFLIIDKSNFKKNWLETKKEPGKIISQIVMGVVLVYGVLVLSSYLLDLLNVSGSSENEAAISSMFSSDPLTLVLLFLLLCVFTPIVEELVFRKVIYNFVEKKFSYIPAILASGFVFGLMHVLAYGDFIQSIPYIAMGCVFGYIYYKSNKNIYVPIAVHFINNFISYLLYVLMVLGVAL